MKRDVPSYRGYRFPPEIISHAVWLYHRAPQQAVGKVLPPSTVTQAAASSSPPGAVGNRRCTAHAIAPMRINTNKDGG